MKCSFSQRTGSFPKKQRRFDNPFSNQVKIPFTYFGCQDYSSKINPDGINFLEIAEFDKNGSVRSSFMPMTLKIRKSTWQPARSVRALEVWGWVLVFIICASSLTRAVELIFKKWDFHFSPFNAFLTVCFWFTKKLGNSTLKLLRPRPRRKSGFKNSDLASTKPKQNIFAYTSLFVLFSAVCTIFLFVFKNAYLLNFSSLLKLSFRLRNSERPGECSPDEDCCR